MLKEFSVLFLLISVFFIGCRKTNNSDALTISHDNQSREYLIHIPDSYDGSTALPMLFNFHGFGGTASGFMNETNMRSLANSENFILVYPQGTRLNGFSHWNAGLDTPDNKSNADDLGFIEALIIELSTQYNVDLERVYACGYSNGSMFSHALACYKSNLIAAIGSVSGAMLDTSNFCSPTHPTAVINIHGTSDNVLPYNGSNDYLPNAVVLNYWINHNNTQQTPIVSSTNDNGTTIEHYQYIQGDSSVSVEHYKVINGEHEWFNMNYQGSNTGNLIWDFVSRYDINGLI
tara:strand:+ start:161 stop:1030 length:870 start_codon:yes stop_codon:yes gene_type:complete